jgi:outer membrane protein TolC
MILVTLGGLTAGAEETEDLTLRKAVEQSTASSPVVAASQRAAAAAADLDRAKGLRLPRIELSQIAQLTDNPAEAFALELSQERFDMNAFFASDPNDPDTLTNWMTRLKLELPISTGGTISGRIDQAEAMLSAADLEHRHAIESAAIAAVEAYINLAKAREQLEVLRTARETTVRHRELAEQYAAEGLLVEAEVLKARVHEAEVNELVEQARSGADLALAALNLEMGLEQDRSHALGTLPAPPAVSGTVGDWVDAAKDRRNDLRAARLAVEAGELEVRVQRAAQLPQVGLDAHYDIYDEDPFGTSGASGSIMLAARWQLLDGGSTRAAVASARHSARAHEASTARFAEGVALEVRQAWQQLITARARRSTADASVAAAEEAQRVRELRFRQGLDRMIDLLDADTELREARLRELVARYDELLATYTLHYASGASIISLVDASTEDNR